MIFLCQIKIYRLLNVDLGSMFIQKKTLSLYYNLNMASELTAYHGHGDLAQVDGVHQTCYSGIRLTTDVRLEVTNKKKTLDFDRKGLWCHLSFKTRFLAVFLHCRTIWRKISKTSARIPFYMTEKFTNLHI